MLAVSAVKVSPARQPVASVAATAATPTTWACPSATTCTALTSVATRHGAVTHTQAATPALVLTAARPAKALATSAVPTSRRTASHLRNTRAAVVAPMVAAAVVGLTAGVLAPLLALAVTAVASLVAVVTKPHLMSVAVAVVLLRLPVGGALISCDACDCVDCLTHHGLVSCPVLLQLRWQSRWSRAWWLPWQHSQLGWPSWLWLLRVLAWPRRWPHVRWSP